MKGKERRGRSPKQFLRNDPLSAKKYSSKSRSRPDQPSKDAVIIQRATDADFLSLHALYSQSVRRNREGFIQDLDYHGCLAAKSKAWREQGGDMLVAYSGGKLVGMGGLAPENEGSAELCKLHVDAACQGRGIGRFLVERLIGLARQGGFAELVLHVTGTQKAAIRLYETIGFHRLREEVFITQVFDKPTTFPTIFMRLPLTDSAQKETRADATASREAAL